MLVTPTPLAGLMLIQPQVFSDSRGFFYESFNERDFRARTGADARFVQDNHSLSARGVVRGLHYQLPQAQGKLVRVTRGAVLDVVLDIRRSSPTFGQWFSQVLSASNKLQLWLPAGFAHGFSVLEDETECLYKTTDYWIPEQEHTILWNDPALAIDWQLQGEPILSDKDRNGIPLAQAAVFE
ncbi:dTDP-4-dehydrorhamnose 3,5-epimerase [Herbaspirillum sp. VT-16-41]|uniref:dTDP-4-dehydrorhamnose 3,5-epimerase n=1 Tax=Herbaspirillum sp. VT-16-41 TaxID=1953765 RepID=UPI000981D519|nr:dTDP-4-dehydrorhamnose 3,5-epimerase [Herbaspirillum sp. VT-16-41]ONN66988.1 dTDP-4-dehydrorhamnose 3,5-epimerase [Herbaspirillum sp. VT-16-41]